MTEKLKHPPLIVQFNARQTKLKHHDLQVQNFELELLVAAVLRKCY